MSKEQEFLALVARIRAINPEAADWLEGADKPEYCNFYPCGELTAAMVWSETPQGSEFWSEIERRVGCAPAFEHDRVERQRDDLAAALERIAVLGADGIPAEDLSDMARAALAKIQS